MATVKFDNATRVYPGATRPSVDKLNIDIADGEFLVLVGPSGCGKSTSLRMLAGLEEVNGGKIWIGDRDVTNLSPKDRDVAMVFQNYALYPHMSVADNMGFALKLAKVDQSEIDRRVEEAAETLDLTEYLHRKPKALALSFNLGGEAPLFATAIGRAALMALSEDRQAELLERARAKARPETRDRLTGWLDKAREDYARYGYCTSFGEWREEIHGIAAPVILPDRSRNVAVNVGGLSFFNPPEQLIAEHGDRLLRAAANLSLRQIDDDR